MAKDIKEIERMQKELGCEGEKLTKELIESRVAGVHWFNQTTMGVKQLFCTIAMQTNNPDKPFLVTGQPSTCIDPNNWREDIAKKVSYDNTFDLLWQLEAYRHMTRDIPLLPEFKLPDGFECYESKPVYRVAYELTPNDIENLVTEGGKAEVTIKGNAIKFAYHCDESEIKAGDFVVFLNESDTYHCSREVFEQRNKILQRF